MHQASTTSDIIVRGSRDWVVTLTKAFAVAAFLAFIAGLLWTMDGAIAAMFDRDPKLAEPFMAPWFAWFIVALSILGLGVTGALFVFASARANPENEQ